MHGASARVRRSMRGVGGMGQQMYTTYPHGKTHELHSTNACLFVFMSSIGIMPMATAQQYPTLLNTSYNPSRELYQEVSTVPALGRPTSARCPSPCARRTAKGTAAR